MPNWAYSNNIFVGKKEKLQEFMDKLLKIINSEGSDKTSWSLVDVCRSFGIDTKSVNCKGDIEHIELGEKQGDGICYCSVKQSSTWYGTPEIWQAILHNGGYDFEYSYYVEEPGLNTWVKFNDKYGILPAWALEHFERSKGLCSLVEEYYFCDDAEMLRYFNETYDYSFASFEELKSQYEEVLSRISTNGDLAKLSKSIAENGETVLNPEVMFASDFAQMHFIQVIQD